MYIYNLSVHNIVFHKLIDFVAITLNVYISKTWSFALSINTYSLFQII